MSGILATLIWFGVIWYIISKVAAKDDKKKQTTINGKPVNKQNQTAEMVGNLVRENVAKFEKQASQWMNTASGMDSQRANANSATSSRTAPSTAYGAMNQQTGTGRTQTVTRSAAEYGAALSPKGRPYRAAKEPTPDIVQRAKANTKKYEADETLHELEREHKHSEKVSSAEAAYVAKEREDHLKLHMEGAPRVEDENFLGSVEDLMVKGYDGNLSFERDFIGEAMDMINRFTLAD